MMDLVITNGTIVTASDLYLGDIGVRNGCIAQIAAPGTLRAETRLDATDKFVLPGLIDPHVHFDLPWLMAEGGESMHSADDYRSGTRAAAAGGVTTVLDFAVSRPGSSPLLAIAERQKKAEQSSVVDYGLHVILTDWSPEVLEVLPDLLHAGVSSVKLFMPYAIGANDTQILATLSAMTRLGGLTMIHAESACAIDWLVKRTADAGELGPASHYRTRPSYTEADGTARAGRLAQTAGAAFYNVHMSSAEALAELVAHQDRGIVAIGETCPHFLSLDRSLMDRPDGEKYTCTPPLRGPEDRDALWEAVRTGRITTIGSDHAPWRHDRHKSVGRSDFRLLPHGLPTLETMLPVLLTYGFRDRGIPLTRLVAVTATNPARIFGLYPRKGVIAPGADADLVLVDMDEPRVVNHNSLQHNMDYSPWEGESLVGWPTTTVSRGQIIFADSTVVGEAGRGLFLARGKPILDSALVR